MVRLPGVDALREALAGLNLETRGHKDTLKKRLRGAEKRQAGQTVEEEGAPSTRPEGQDFDSFLVLDFEASCQLYEECHGDFFGFPNEVCRSTLPFRYAHSQGAPRSSNFRSLCCNGAASLSHAAPRRRTP